MKPTLVVLAAGAGRRYGGLKQLAPIGPSGETLLEYSAFDALRAGFERIVLVVRRETEPAFRQRLDTTLGSRAPITYVHQRLGDLPDGLDARDRVKPWGTGHAVLATEGEIDGPFAVVNADDSYGSESYVTLATFLREAPGRSLAAVGFEVADTLTDTGPVSRALLTVGDEGDLQEIVELLEVWREGDRIVHRDSQGRRQTIDEHELVSMNMWGFSPQLFTELRPQFADFLARPDLGTDAEFLLPDAVQSLVSSGLFRGRVLAAGGDWCGLTFSEDLERVRSTISSLVDEGRYPKDLWARDTVWTDR